jgi:hypothetical protein
MLLEFGEDVLNSALHAFTVLLVRVPDLITPA